MPKEAKYINGCVVIRDKIKICGDGRIQGNKSIYQVNGLYESFKRYLEDYLPQELTAQEVKEFYDYEVYGPNRFKVRIDKDEACKVSLFGNSILEFKAFGFLKVYNGEVEYNEMRPERLGDFVNDMFGGLICEDVTVRREGVNLVFETNGEAVLRIKKDGFEILKDFCLIYGRIRGVTEVFTEWILEITKDMDIKGIKKWGSLIDLILFEYGISEIGISRRGEFKSLVWSKGGLTLKIDLDAVRIKYNKNGRVISLVDFLEERIGRILHIDDSFLRALIF